MTSTLSFIVGMVVGVLFGGTVGLAVASICAAARDADEARPEDDRADTAALGALRVNVVTEGRIYATRPAAPQPAGECLRAIREYLAAHEGIGKALCGHAMDDAALEIARIALDFQQPAPPARGVAAPCRPIINYGEAVATGRAFVNYNPLDVLKELSAAMGYHGAVGYCIVMSDYMRKRLNDTIAFHVGGRAGGGLRKQGGYINLDGLFLSLVTVGAIAGGIAVLAVVYGGPWAWDLVKPWLHEVTQ